MVRPRGEATGSNVKNRGAKRDNSKQGEEQEPLISEDLSGSHTLKDEGLHFRLINTRTRYDLESAAGSEQ